MNWLESSFWIASAKAAAWTAGLPIINPDTPDRNTYTGFSDYFKDLVDVAVGTGTIVAIMIVIYAGIIYGKSQGKPDEINKAKELVAGSLTGIALLLLIRLVTPTLGISVQ